MSSNDQSWTSYILSAYSSSVSPPQDSDLYAPNAARFSSSTSKPVSKPGNRTTTTTTSLPSPASPTFPFGSPALSHPTTTTSSSSSPWGPYTKSGRGGAGNFTWETQKSAGTTNASSPPVAAQAVSDEEAGLESQACMSIVQRQKEAAETEERERNDVLQARAQKGEEGQEEEAGVRYAHTGRGGAGNWSMANDSFTTSSATVGREVGASVLDPTEPIASTSSSSSTTATTTTTKTTITKPKPKSKPRTGYLGRGGAGNHTSNLETLIAETAQADAAAEAAEQERKRRKRILGLGREDDEEEQEGRRGHQNQGWSKGKVVESVEMEIRRPEGVVVRDHIGKE